MAKDPSFLLRSKFLCNIERNWIQNDHNLKNISCVYAIIGYDLFSGNKDIFYIGSTTQLFNRYKSHSVPLKVQSLNNFNILYYLPMDKGFYDYEIKLINRLKPILNKQHINKWH